MSLETIIEKFNNFFKNDIFDIYEKHKSSKSRSRKIKINDMLKFLFIYSKKENTKEIAAAKSNSDVTRSCFSRKLKNINIEFFNDLFNKIKEFKDDLISGDDELFNLNNILNNKIKVLDKDFLQFDICSGDGTCNDEINKGSLFTNSNVHIYNNSKQEPYDIIDNHFEVFDNNKNNTSNKNREIALLLNFIESKSKDELKKIIIILDRAYSSYDLILKLNEYNVKYIIRLKDNLDILSNKIKTSTNVEKINEILRDPNVKIIKNTVETDNEFVLNVNEIKTIKTKNNYHLITNLGDAKDFNNNLIIDLYKYRWEIEVYFKKIKNLFKYQTFYLKNKEEIFKMKIISNIIFILVKTLILISLKYNYDSSIEKLGKVVNKKVPKKIDKRTKEYKEKQKDYLNSKTYEGKVNINFNHFYSIFSDNVLINLIDGNFNIKDIKILNEAIIVNKNKQNRKFIRRSLIPFSKWYVKMYHKIYQEKQIYKAIITKNVDKLNKNLKLKAEQIIRDLNK